MTFTPPVDPTLAYDESQAKTFFAETVDVDMAPLYTRFLARVTPGGRILDTGCGAGAIRWRFGGWWATA